jgi:glycosyltransferase involved in cell wall biosynthesis
VILPNGGQNPFFLQEKQWLLERFGAFDVVCPRGIYRCEEAGELKPLESKHVFKTIRAVVAGTFDPELYREILRMIKDKAANLVDILRLWHFSVNTAQMYYFVRKSLKKGTLEDTVLYSYWLSYDAAAIAKLKREHPQVYTLARAHSYEIQLERYACNPYLMKRLICKYMDEIAFIAEDSQKRFCSYYKKDLPNACVRYLGSDQKGAGFVPRGKKEKLTVLTCSSVVPVKRLDRMIQALETWDKCPVHWVHIGDGADGEKIRAMAQEKLESNPLISYEFAGYMDNRQVHERLKRDDIDVFVNCSQTEGVPVSIMEAMSVGLPVIAPRMFGIPELVKEDCGILFEQAEGTVGLRHSLEEFAKLSEKAREDMGRKAFTYWERDFCLQKNLQELFAPVLKAK